MTNRIVTKCLEQKVTSDLIKKQLHNATMRLGITFVALLCVIIVSGSEVIEKSSVSSEKSTKEVQNLKTEVKNTVEKLKVNVISDKVSELDDLGDEDEILNEGKFDDVIQIPSSSSLPSDEIDKSENKSGKLELDPAIQNSQYDPNYTWGEFWENVYKLCAFSTFFAP